jgi:tetratricopeptide (TPR) repeat protein
MDAVVTLSISQAGSGPQRTFLFHVEVDGEPVAAKRLTGGDARAVRDLARQYSLLFRGSHSPYIASEGLQAVGAEMFRLWLEPAWDKVKARVGSRFCLLVVASDVPDVLNLPWELVRPPDGDFVGIDGQFSVRRLPWPDRRLGFFNGNLRPRPLRILFMACAPRDAVELDFEREEECVYKAVAGAGPNVVLETADLGTFEELRQRINDFKPHVVHLSGHGRVTEDGVGWFLFEDEAGGPDPRPAQDIARELFGADSGVQCVFVSGCETGQAPQASALGGVCQGLLRGGVPLAVGWAASVADPVATQFAMTFYNTLAADCTVDRAMRQARQAVYKACTEGGDPSWALPVLYASSMQGLVYDADHKRDAEPPPRETVVQQPLPGMTEGYAESFVGRRREQQRLLPALRDGRLQTLIITGLGGVGKSALATRLARKLQAEGYAPIAAPSSAESPLSIAGLLQACGDVFLQAGLGSEHATVREATLSVEDRLRYVVGVLNKHRFVLVLDNFETNLNERSRCILGSELAGFYRHLLANLTSGSRVIITSRYLPADVPELPATAREEPLGDLSEASFIKFLLRDPEVEHRFYAGELPCDLLVQLHRLLGGAPRFLGQAREVLKEMTADELRRDLAAVQLPDRAEPSVLQAIRDQYCETIFTARLYGYLDIDARRALSRAAVYGIAANMDALEAVTGEPPDRLRAFIRQWHERAFAYPERDRGAGELWAVYGLVRPWLVEQLDPDEARAARRAAGNYLRYLAAQDRDSELGLLRITCLLEARAQYLAAGDHEQARALTDYLSNALMLIGAYREVVRLNLELLEYEEHPMPMNWIGGAQYELGEYSSARDWYRQCLEIAGDRVPKQAAVAWHGLATIDLRQSDYPGAREKLEKSLKIKQEIGDRAGEAATWNNLAMIELSQGDYAGAREKVEKTLKINQEVGNRAGEAGAWHQLGSIDLDQGDYLGAHEKCEKALKINQEIGNRAGEAGAWHQLALLKAHQGDYAGAREGFERSLKIMQEIGDRAGVAATLHNLASNDFDQGDYARAREKFEKALKMRQEIGDRAGVAATLHNLASIDLEQGDYAEARERLEKSLNIKQEVGDRAGEAATLYQLGYLAKKVGRRANGAKLVAACFLIEKAIGHGDAPHDLKALEAMTRGLTSGQEQLQLFLEEVARSYGQDRGWSLIEEAFKGLDLGNWRSNRKQDK